jgi:hypothetical protein
MIRIAITEAAFEAIAATLSLGSVGYENETNERGERTVWPEAAMVDRLGASALHPAFSGGYEPENGVRIGAR